MFLSKGPINELVFENRNRNLKQKLFTENQFY